VLTDPGCYEERFRLTGGGAWSLVPVLLFIVPAIFASFPLPVRVVFLVLGVALVLPSVIGPASRMTAFRADPAGVTLGADPAGWPLGRISAVTVPWADVEGIILYQGPGPRWGDRDVQCIGIQRRQGSPALPWGNEPASGCPVPGVAAGAARRIGTWRLDRERLAAVTAAVAPGMPIIEAGTGPGPSIEGPSRGGNGPELGPVG
jgi:hypothetical protein